MLKLDIGNYTFSASHDHDYYIRFNRPTERSGTEDKIKSYDHVLHQSLDKIFRERCLSSSDQIKEFIRDPRHRTEQESIIKPILEQFPDGDFRKHSLLWIAVLGCCEKSAELLVRSGADVNELFGRRDPQVIDEKWTILHVLIQMDPSQENERLIRLVADHGADLQVRDHNERTVLQRAVTRARVQMTGILLEKGADVNAADNNGVTPLLAAAMGDKPNELVPLLMKHGADVFAKDIRGYNACYYLSYSKVEPVELARVLIEKGVPLEENTNDNSQAIHLAAMYGRNELVKLFLDYGANVNAQNEDGRSALYVPVLYGYNTVAETLLKRGARINLRTMRGRTALHGICEYVGKCGFLRHKLYERTIRLLLSADADVLIEDHDGKTPFALISSGGNGEPPGIRLMIETLALRKARLPSIELKDERIIEQYPKLRDYYRKCTEEIDRMKLTGFIETCTFFELLAKSQCQIAALMQNPEFESKFNFYNLNGFPIYNDKVLRAFERAQKHYHAMLDQQNVINEAVYDILPYLVVKKVVQRIFDDCCSENVK